jgi:peptidoglycan/xylan/chitin deacetylase (PgdA/CDA1 family)
MRICGSLKFAGLRALGSVSVGLHRLLGSRAGSAVGILTYHRIAPHFPGVPRPRDTVTPSRLHEQLRGLMDRGFTFRPLGQMLESRARGEPVPPRTLVVTFDDGFQAVHTHAWPVLRELRVPAIVFLATSYLDGHAPFPFDPWGITWSNALPPDAYRPLTTAQCRDLLDGGLVELGAHTHSHRDFRGRPETLYADLKVCLRVLRERFGLPSGVPFAFPFGKPHEGYACEASVAAVKAAGVLCALSTESRLVDPCGDPFHWGRFNVFPWDTSTTLSAKVSGWYSWAPALRARLLSVLRRGDAQPAAAVLRKEIP